MKNKIFMFVMGFIAGVIIATIGCFVFQRMNHRGMPDGERPQMTRRGDRDKDDLPPDKPDEEQNNTQTTLPNDQNTTNETNT